MWWVSFVSGCVVGAVLGVLFLAMVIASGDDRHGRG